MKPSGTSTVSSVLETRKMDNSPEDEKLGAKLDECFERLLSGLHRGSSVHRDVAESQPIVSALATLSRITIEDEAEDQIEDEVDVGKRADQSSLSIGKYTIQRCLGRGGQSIVFLANDPDLRREVVIKLHFSAGSPDIQDRLLTEARHLADVRHPNVVQCYGVDRYDGIPYIVMEFIQGHSLQTVLEEGPVSLNTALQIVADMAAGLVAVHARGILHGDVKPGNILIGEDGRPRLADFGFSRPIVDRESRSVPGTAAYMAPEQARNDADQLDVRADIFGLGAVFYELLTGQPPHKGSSRSELLERACEAQIIPPSQLDGNIPDWVETLCMRCLERDPVQRIDPAELKTRIQMRLEGRTRRFWAVGAAVVVASALSLGFLLVSGWRSPQNGTPTLQPAKSQLGNENLPDDALHLVRADGEPRRDFDFRAGLVGHPPDESGLVQLVHRDIVQFEIEASRDCFATILWLTENDLPTQLFPDPDYESYRDAFLSTGERRQLPTPPADGRIAFEPIIATPSTGPEALCIILSTRPLKLGDANSDGRFLVFQTPEQREKLYSRLRGFTRETHDSDSLISVQIIPVQVRAR